MSKQTNNIFYVILCIIFISNILGVIAYILKVSTKIVQKTKPDLIMTVGNGDTSAGTKSGFGFRADGGSVSASPFGSVTTPNILNLSNDPESFSKLYVDAKSDTTNKRIKLNNNE